MNSNGTSIRRCFPDFSINWAMLRSRSTSTTTNSPASPSTCTTLPTAGRLRVTGSVLITTHEIAELTGHLSKRVTSGDVSRIEAKSHHQTDAFEWTWVGP